MAELIQRLLTGWPDLRVLVVTHVAELIEQNYLELLGAWPFAPAGIFSAGLGRRDAHSRILFAGIQTVWNKADRIGHADVLMVDECHLIPAKSETMYGKFISDLWNINPDLKIVGLTATPFRLDSGRLVGDGTLFDDAVYEYGIGDGIADGWLAPLSSKGTDTGFDLTGVGRVGGDYKQNALQAAVDKEAVTAAAVQEIVAKGHNRRSWLCFCSGVEHAIHVRDEIRRHGISCETVTGETPKEERRRIIEDFKSYRLRAVTNNSVLTTGFNHKGVDLIAALRPTLSASLYLQMMGRGTRPIYAPGMPQGDVDERRAAIAAGPKPDCLVLDFAGLVRKHGPVDMVKPKEPGKGQGEAPVRLCPQCEELVHISVMTCPCCGHEFPPSEEVKFTAQADIAPILSTAAPVWHAVTARTFRRHEKPGGLPSVRCDYMLGMTAEKEWLCPEHTGYPKAKADRYWAKHGGQRPFPKTVDEWIDRVDELFITREISLKPRPGTKYTDVKDWLPGAANDNYPAMGKPLQRKRVMNAPTWSGDLDDSIPF